MFVFLDNEPQVDVLDSEYARLLGFPRHRALEGRSLELAQSTRDWYRQNGRPWIYLREVSDLEVREESFQLDGRLFHSPFVQRYFAQAEVETAFVAAVSAGPECEARAAELWKEGKPDEYFFMEMYGGAVVEHLIAKAGARLCEWADENGMFALPHYSPGYPEWDVSEQTHLLEALRADALIALPAELGCLESGMLRPKKSLLGLFGVTRASVKAPRIASLIPCESCALPGCAYRRKPYLMESIEPETLESSVMAETLAATPREPKRYPLDISLSYATNVKALRKWSLERLSIEEESDGTIAARFRYEGSTCSNMGHPLAYVYDIRLDSERAGFRVLEADCQPAEGDEGHKKMCEYLKRKDQFVATMQSERPMLGKRLDAVAEWDLPGSHAGCYCEVGGRNHKWRLVYEVIHYTLSQRYRIAEASPVGAANGDRQPARS